MKALNPIYHLALKPESYLPNPLPITKYIIYNKLYKGALGKLGLGAINGRI